MSLNTIRKIAIAFLAAFALGITSGCDRLVESDRARAARITGGDPNAGALKVRTYGCVGCHAIPDISAAEGMVAPSLKGIGARKTLANQLPNTPANMMQWIQHPRAVSPHTTMPDMGVTLQDSRDIAAFLYTLR